MRRRSAAVFFPVLAKSTERTLSRADFLFNLPVEFVHEIFGPIAYRIRSGAAQVCDTDQMLPDYFHEPLSLEAGWHSRHPERKWGSVSPFPLPGTTLGASADEEQNTAEDPISRGRAGLRQKSKRKLRPFPL